MKRILVLSTDTLHHRFFINFLVTSGIRICGCIFETTEVKPGFAIGPFYEQEEYDFEKNNFFTTVPFEYQAEIEKAANVNAAECMRYISSIKPDFGIVFGTRKLSVPLISLFPDGLLNVHRGIAQFYRGVDSAYWAIHQDDFANIGVTIHRVDAALDTGAVAYQERLELTRGMKIFQLRYYTTSVAARLTLRACQDYGSARLTCRPQERTGAYYSFMPLDLKYRIAEKFDHYTAGINA